LLTLTPDPAISVFRELKVRIGAACAHRLPFATYDVFYIIVSV
jgi:hypothetical protein